MQRTWTLTPYIRIEEATVVGLEWEILEGVVIDRRKDWLLQVLALAWAIRDLVKPGYLLNQK